MKIVYGGAPLPGMQADLCLPCHVCRLTCVLAYYGGLPSLLCRLTWILAYYGGTPLPAMQADLDISLLWRESPPCYAG